MKEFLKINKSEAFSPLSLVLKPFLRLCRFLDKYLKNARFKIYYVFFLSEEEVQKKCLDCSYTAGRKSEMLEKMQSQENEKLFKHTKNDGDEFTVNILIYQQLTYRQNAVSIKIQVLPGMIKACIKKTIKTTRKSRENPIQYKLIKRQGSSRKVVMKAKSQFFTSM